MTYSIRGDVDKYVVGDKTGMIVYEKDEWLEDSDGLITSAARYSGICKCETTLDIALRVCEVFQP